MKKNAQQILKYFLLLFICFTVYLLLFSSVLYFLAELFPFFSLIIPLSLTVAICAGYFTIKVFRFPPKTKIFMQISAPIISCMIIIYLFMASTGYHPPKPFIAVALQDGILVFYLSEDSDFITLPNLCQAFSISDMSIEYGKNRDAWRIVTAAGNYKHPACNINKYECITYSRLLYGEEPKCFETLVPPAPLKRNVEYRIFGSCVPSNNCNESVYFKLIPCKKDSRNICLETNSPAPVDIKIKHRLMCQKALSR